MARTARPASWDPDAGPRGSVELPFGVETSARRPPSANRGPVPDVIESLARAIHEGYVQRHSSEPTLAAGQTSTDPWETLPETLRASNRRQAADIEHKLRAISCEAVAGPGTGEVVDELDDNEVERLAEIEHDRWMAERLAAGWTPGAVKDVDAKRTPFLVPWADLSEVARDLDRDMVRQIPRLLAAIGFTVVRRGSSEGPSTPPAPG